MKTARRLLPFFLAMLITVSSLFGISSVNATGPIAEDSTYTRIDTVINESTQVADLSLTSTADKTYAASGEVVAFTVSVTNSGPDTATNVVVVTLLSAGLTLTNFTTTQGQYSSPGIWSFPSLAANASATIIIYAQKFSTGTVQIDASVTSDQLDSNAANNSLSTMVMGTGTIQFTSSQNEVTYDKQNHGIILDVQTPDAVVSYRTTPSGEYNLATAPTFQNAGIYTVWYQIVKDNYTTVEGSAIVKINNKNLTVTVAVNNKFYDGLNSATFHETPTLSGVEAGDLVTLINGTPTFSSVAIGTGIAVNLTNFGITGNDANNYTLTQPTNVTADILPGFTPLKNVHFSVSGAKINGDFVISAAANYLISLTNTADGNWQSTLTFSGKTANETVVFYLKSTSTGIISISASEVVEKPVTVPNTGDTGSVSLWIILGSLTLLIIFSSFISATLKKKCLY